MFELGYYTGTLNWVITIIIGLITVYLVRFYLRVLALPKGPFPLPVLGNVLSKYWISNSQTFYQNDIVYFNSFLLVFRKTKVNQFITINELHKTYGPVFTLWLGTSPMVVISDYNLIKKAFNSKDNELMGRIKTNFGEALLQTGKDVVFSDHGPVWASLRRVGHSAVRYSWILNFLLLFDFKY